MDLKSRLQRFYELRCPSKCVDVETLSIKYKHKEKDLFRQLTFKYGPEPPMSAAEKSAIKQRSKNIIPNKPIQKTTTTTSSDWMMSLLDQNSLELLKEMDNYEGKNIPQHILDRI